MVNPATVTFNVSEGRCDGSVVHGQRQLFLFTANSNGHLPVVPPPRLNEARDRAIGHYEWMGVSGGPATRRRFLSADGGGKACRSALA